MQDNSCALRILILGDSTALPREEVPYEKTWVGILKRQNPEFDIIDKSDRGASTLRLVTAGGNGIDTLELYSPDISILQMGVTESAPRLFDKKSFEYFFLNSLMPRRLRPRYVSRVKKRRIRSPQKADTTPEKFKGNLSSYARRAALSGTEVILLPIAPPGEELKSKSPLFPAVINTFNDIMRTLDSEFKNVTFTDPFPPVEKMKDHWLDEVHYDEDVHAAIADGLHLLIHDLVQ